MNRNVQKEITDKVIAALKTGVAPWRKPWKAYAEPSSNFPRNAKSGRPYSGGNVVLLWMTAQARGYRSNEWVTYGQAVEMKGNVRKGEKGTQITFLSTFEKPDPKDASKKKKIPFLRLFTVFNVEQCEGLTTRKAPTPINKDQRDALAEEFVVSTKAVIHHGGSSAFYRQLTDDVTMPVFASFKGADEYYCTLFHELAHWTGHPSRLDRTKGKRFGDREYAYEELVAELTSAFIAAEFGFDNSTFANSTSYIANWIKAFEEHENLFMSVASEASKAVAFMRGLAIAEEVHEQAA